MSYLRLQESENRINRQNNEPLFAKNKVCSIEKHALEEIKNLLPNNNNQQNLEATNEKKAKLATFDKDIESTFKTDSENENLWIIESWDCYRPCCFTSDDSVEVSDEEIWSFYNPINADIFENILMTHYMYLEEELEEYNALTMKIQDKMADIEAAKKLNAKEDVATEEKDFEFPKKMPVLLDIEAELESFNKLLLNI